MHGSAQPQPNDHSQTKAFVPGSTLSLAALFEATPSPAAKRELARHRIA